MYADQIEKDKDQMKHNDIATSDSSPESTDKIIEVEKQSSNNSQISVQDTIIEQELTTPKTSNFRYTRELKALGLDVDKLQEESKLQDDERTREIINTFISIEDVDEIFDYALNLTEEDKNLLYPYIESVLKDKRIEEFCFNTALE